MVIVVGVDDSKSSAAAANRAVAEADRWDAELQAVHVADVPMRMIEAFSDESAVVDAYIANQRRATWRRIDPLLANTDVKKIELQGVPADELVSHVGEVAADLLILGTRGRGTVQSILLGSTSHRAFHLAPCDVMVVKTD